MTRILTQYDELTQGDAIRLRAARRIARDVAAWCGDTQLADAATQKDPIVLRTAMRLAHAAHGNAPVQAAMWKYASWVTASMPWSAWVPDAVAAKLHNDIQVHWLSLTDAEAFTVLLSVPVVESDGQKALESVILACQAAAGVFGGNAITSFSVHTLLNQGNATRDLAISAECVPLRDLIADVACMQSPDARRGLRDRVVTALKAMDQQGIAVARFLRALRACYTEADVVRAFATQNLEQSTTGTEKTHVQAVISQANLGALSSAYMATSDLTSAWATMNLRGYLEMLRWEGFKAQTPNLMRIVVKALVKKNDALLRETLVDGSYAADVILRLLDTPSMKDYGLSDIRNRDSNAREFVLYLLQLADLVRNAGGVVTDDVLHAFTVLMNTHVASSQVDALRRVCEKCLPVHVGLAALPAAI